MSRERRAFSAGEARAGRPAPADDDELRRRLRVEVARYCPRALRDRVDDIVQLAWMRLDAAGRKSARNRTPGTSLIKRVAFCTAMDESRRLARRREVPIAELQQPAAQQANPAEAAEIRCAIQDCLAAMIRNRRLAVTLYLLGHTARQAGRLLGWSTSKTESLVFRGLHDLRRCLEGKGITP